MYLTHLSGTSALSSHSFVPLPGEHGTSDPYSGVLEPSEMSYVCVRMLSMLGQLLSPSTLSVLNFVLPPGMFGHFESAAHVLTILCVHIHIRASSNAM